MLVFKPTTMIEYFEDILYSQPKVDNCNMFHREIVVLVGHGQNVDFIKKRTMETMPKVRIKAGVRVQF